MLSIMLTNIIVAALAIISAVFSENTFTVLLLGGILMILVTAGFISDRQDRLIKYAQLAVAVLFAVFAGGWYGFLIFACIISLEMWQVLVLAEAIYFVFSIVSFVAEGKFTGYNMALMLLNMILIFIINFAITGVWRIIKHMDDKKEADQQRIRNYSLSEMQEIQRNRQLAQQSFYVDKNARLMERENISRNIHNSVGHSITAAIMTLDAADMLFETRPVEAHKRMNDAADRIRGSLEAIRSAVRALDAEGEDVSAADMVCYTDNIIDEFMMDTDRTCDKIYDIYSDDIKIPKEHAEFLTGALSEFLTNGVKHGEATHFIVKLSGDSSHIRLDVSDNGKSSFNEENRKKLIQNGFGLKKLISYAERCGGKAEFKNDVGFSSMIELPIKAAAITE